MNDIPVNFKKFGYKINFIAAISRMDEDAFVVWKTPKLAQF